MNAYISRIPKDIVRDQIIPYTYCPQPTALLEDLRSYHLTMSRAKALYREKLPTESYTDVDNSDMAWLCNDICRFLNNDQPTMFGIVEFYKTVFRRLYMNQSKLLDDVPIPYILSDNCKEINVSIGLLLVDERRNLETFLGCM